MLSDTEVNLLCAEIASETLDAEVEVSWASMVDQLMAMGEMYTKVYESEWD
jgi:hypothetical protein